MASTTERLMSGLSPRETETFSPRVTPSSARRMRASAASIYGSRASNGADSAGA